MNYEEALKIVEKFFDEKPWMEHRRCEKVRDP